MAHDPYYGTANHRAGKMEGKDCTNRDSRGKVLDMVGKDKEGNLMMTYGSRRLHLNQDHHLGILEGQAGTGKEGSPKELEPACPLVHDEKVGGACPLGVAKL